MTKKDLWTSLFGEEIEKNLSTQLKSVQAKCILLIVDDGREIPNDFAYPLNSKQRINNSRSK